MQNYNDPIIYNWHYNEQTGEKYSVKINNEIQTIINGKVFLNQIPDKFHGVKITGMTERDLISTATDFKVDYANGMITFHTSKEGQQVTISEYYGRGMVTYPASRIWTDIGSMGEVLETLKDVLDLLGNANTLKDEVAETVANLTTLINSPEFAQKVTEAQTTITNLESVIHSADLDNYITQQELDTAMGNKVDKETGKGLSTNDYDNSAKTKVDAIPTNPKYTDTVYTHPASHPASMITQDVNNRFVTDAEKSTWNSKASADVATASANGLMSSAMVTKLNAIPTDNVKRSLVMTQATYDALSQAEKERTDTLYFISG